MGFTDIQVKAMAAKLNAKHVKTRQKGDLVLSYVEGWHAVSEANRIFGFDGWDRETVEARCVWEGMVNGMKACSYVARVRVRVRAGETIVVREGSGSGNGQGTTPGEAHESAAKEAETDAMKRALSTFGNPFGLALYDKEQQGVRQNRTSAAGRRVSWMLMGSTGEPLSEHKDPVAYCSAARQVLESLDDAGDLMAFWKRNQETVAHLRRDLPHLKTEKGQHYGEILGALYTARLQDFAARLTTQEQGKIQGQAQAVDDRGTSGQDEPDAGADPGKPPTDPQLDQVTVTEAASAGKLSATFEQAPRRVRDKEHLQFIASRNCLVCGRFPSQAHHVRFAQPRALGRKVSDEWTVPLCAIHHRALHDFGKEETWWVLQNLDPIKEAENLWNMSRNGKGDARKVG